MANEKIYLPIEDNDEDTDDEIMSLLENKYFGSPRRSLQNLRRSILNLLTQKAFVFFAMTISLSTIDILSILRL